MGKYLRLFETTAEYEAVKSELPIPCVSYDMEADVVIYKEEEDPFPYGDGLYFKNVDTEKGYVKLITYGAPASKTFEYNKGNGWKTYFENSGVYLNPDLVVAFRSTDSALLSAGTYSYRYFELSVKMEASGSVGNLSPMGTDAFHKLFNGCSNLVKAPELPATTLATYCYDSMFKGCTSLTLAPELPALISEYACYLNMFQDCTSLTKAPKLPALILTAYCYSNMFNGCTSLTQAPELPSPSLATYCYDLMFANCTSLTEAPSVLPATTLATYCYWGMFLNCTSLTEAPELPATTLKTGCYRAMFLRCTNLSYVKAMFTSSGTSFITDWLSGVSETGVFVKNSSATWDRDTMGIPTGWTVETA